MGNKRSAEKVTDAMIKFMCDHCSLNNTEGCTPEKITACTLYFLDILGQIEKSDVKGEEQ